MKIRRLNDFDYKFCGENMLFASEENEFILLERLQVLSFIILMLFHHVILYFIKIY